MQVGCMGMNRARWASLLWYRCVQQTLWWPATTSHFLLFTENRASFGCGNPHLAGPPRSLSWRPMRCDTKILLGPKPHRESSLPSFYALCFTAGTNTAPSGAQHPPPHLEESDSLWREDGKGEDQGCWWH